LEKQKNDFEAMRDQIDKLTDITLSLPKKPATEADRIYKLVIWVISSIIIAAVIAGMGMAFFLGRAAYQTCNKAVTGLKGYCRGRRRS
jgi:hypothetical protein